MAGNVVCSASTEKKMPNAMCVQNSYFCIKGFLFLRALLYLSILGFCLSSTKMFYESRGTLESLIH